ncbi:BREX-1 system phosphatase PglZ type A, partial [Muribaculaceae bacterium Isolate-077 (Janvier)]
PTYVLYFGDTQDRPISNEQRYVADSREDDPQSPSRRQCFYLALQDRDFDNSGAYYLIIQNAETKEEIQRIQYQMDLTIKGDFGLYI